jgi:hypothetical protein
MYMIALGIGFAEENAAALVRVGLLAVGAHRVVVFVVNVKHVF